MTMDKEPFWPVVRRGVLGRCPRCGEGRLFQRYLKQVEQCPHCGEKFGHIRADDGPAWLTILLVGHLLAPFFLLVVPDLDWPEWKMMAVVIALTVVLTLLLLPRAKGVFIGLIWRSGCIGSET